MGPNLFGYVFYFFGGMNSKKNMSPLCMIFGVVTLYLLDGEDPPDTAEIQKICINCEMLLFIDCTYAFFTGFAVYVGPVWLKMIRPPKKKGDFS